MKAHLILMICDLSSLCQSSDNMTSKSKTAIQLYHENCEFVKRLVYDVLAFTLSRLGLPEAELPFTDSRENDYFREDFIEMIGIQTLRVAMSLRDRWRQIFIENLSDSGIDEDFLLEFLGTVVSYSPLSWAETNKCAIYASLALCGETVLFLYNTGVIIDPNAVLRATIKYIVTLVLPYRNVSLPVQELLCNFNNSLQYNKWLLFFIEKLAIPYEDSISVSDTFFLETRDYWRRAYRWYSSRVRLTSDDMRHTLGFLPSDLFLRIASETFENLPEVTESSGLLANQESSTSDNSPISESGAVGGMESHESPWTRSEISSKQTSQGGEELGIDEYSTRRTWGGEAASEASQGSLSRRRRPINEPHCNPSTRSELIPEETNQSGEELGIEDDIRKMSLGAYEAPHDRQGALSSRREPINESHWNLWTPAKMNTEQTTQGNEELEIYDGIGGASWGAEATSQDSQDEVSRQRKPVSGPHGNWWNRSEIAHGHGDELGMDNIRRIGLNAAASVSQAIHGAIPKQRKHFNEPYGNQWTLSSTAPEQTAQGGEEPGIDDIKRMSCGGEAATSQASQGAIFRQRKPVSDPHENQSTRSEIASEQTGQGGEELEIDDNIRRMSLSTEATPQASQGTISKRRKPANEPHGKPWSRSVHITGRIRRELTLGDFLGGMSLEASEACQSAISKQRKAKKKKYRK